MKFQLYQQCKSGHMNLNGGRRVLEMTQGLDILNWGKQWLCSPHGNGWETIHPIARAMLKNRSHLVTFQESIVVSLWTFQSNLSNNVSFHPRGIWEMCIWIRLQRKYIFRILCKIWKLEKEVNLNISTWILYLISHMINEHRLSTTCYIHARGCFLSFFILLL